MQPLFDTARKACLPGIWSQGVKLARAGAVTRAAANARELTLRVRAAGYAVAPTVTLYLDELEWSCDCREQADPCSHVAASVIALSSAEAAPSSPSTSPEKTARLVYQLAVHNRRLTLTRSFVYSDGREQRLSGGLAREIAKNTVPAGVTPTHEDLTIDRILGVPARDAVPLNRIADVLRALSDAEVSFRGRRARVSGELVLPQAFVDDAEASGFVVRIERDPAVTEVVAMGVALCGEVLRPLGATNTTGQSLERLPLSRVFGATQEAELVAVVLPELEKQLRVTCTAKKLPRLKSGLRPRIEMDLSHQGHTLSVLPTLVYGDPAIARVDGDAMVLLGSDAPVRDPDAERALLQRLRDELNLVPGRRLDFNGSEAIRFAEKLRRWEGGKARRQTPGAAFEARPLVPRLEFQDGVFDVVFECVPGSDELPAPPKRAQAAAVLRAWHDGIELVPLEGGGWAPLPSDWLSKYGDRVADLLAARDDEAKLQRAALPELAALYDALEAPKPFSLDRLAPLADGFTGIPRAELPPNIQATLRTYQEHGFDWLTFLRDANLGGVLADDMGLGKTLQTICALRGRVLVVCPKSVVYNWAEEIARFRPLLRTVTYHGSKRELDRKADVTLTTYSVLRLDADRLAKENWDVVVLDEAQAIKNDASQTARAAFGLKADFRVALSGTPIENRLEELWSVMHFANPGLLGGRSHFQQRYVLPIANGDASAAERLRAKIRPFVLRRLKRDVLPELPPRSEAVLHVELDETERSIYDAVRVATKKDLVEKLSHGGTVLAALEALLRLRQAACHAALVPGQQAATSSKIERLLEALTEATADGHKALVFSQWTRLLDLVEPHLAQAGIGFTRLDGSTRDRAGVVAEFQNDAGPPVMLVSLKAGGTGLNLTAADHVFLLDPWWNPAVEDQAADRAHRIGQERSVMVYRMVAKDTVEERIFGLQQKKRDLAAAALSGTAGTSSAITRDDLLALLD
jgi:superfamily II DNA or RNA helicase